MPFGDRQLRSNDDGLSLEAGLKYLEQSQPRVVVERLRWRGHSVGTLCNFYKINELLLLRNTLYNIKQLIHL